MYVCACMREESFTDSIMLYPQISISVLYPMPLDPLVVIDDENTS